MWDEGSGRDTAPIVRPRRRQLLFGVGSALLAAGTVGIGQVAGQEGDVTVSLKSVRTTAWELTDVEGPEEVAPTGEQNPALTLRVGTRYTFENPDVNFHPLAFRDENDNQLLSQRGRGRFEDDADVNWIDEDETLVFTLTEDLAEQLDDYVCVLHPRMNGLVEIDGRQGTPAAAVTFSQQTIDGTSVTVDAVRMDDGGFVTVHDEGLLEGDALGSVVGVSEHLDPGSYDSVTVDLEEAVADDQTLVAMPHRDTNDNETYDFVESEGGADGPYTDDDGAVTDAADVTVETDDESDETDNSDGENTISNDDSDGEDTDGTGGDKTDSSDGEDTDSTGGDETDSSDSENTDSTGGNGGNGDDTDGSGDSGGMAGETDDGDDEGDADRDDSGPESADDSGPGFGPITGVAGLGGLVSYAYRQRQPDDDTHSAGVDERGGE